MFRYIIIIWNVNNASDCDAASGMRRRMTGFSDQVGDPALDRPGMYVACVDQEFSSDAAIPIDDCRGVILGTIFRSTGTPSFESPRPRFDILSPITRRQLSGQRADR